MSNASRPIEAGGVRRADRGRAEQPGVGAEGRPVSRPRPAPQGERDLAGRERLIAPQRGERDSGRPASPETCRCRSANGGSPGVRPRSAPERGARGESQVRTRRRLTESPVIGPRANTAAARVEGERGSVWPASPRWARIRTHGRARPRRARRAVDDTAPEKTHECYSKGNRRPAK